MRPWSSVTFSVSQPLREDSPDSTRALRSRALRIDARIRSGDGPCAAWADDDRSTEPGIAAAAERTPLG